MKQFIVIASVIFVSLFAAHAQGYSQLQSEAKGKISSAPSSNVKPVYTCPMHPEVISRKQGKCPKCGMNLVKIQSEVESKLDVKHERSMTQDDEKTGTMLVANAKKNLQEAKAKLAEEGKYNCCIKDPCNTCALEENECGCAKDIKTGKHVCLECYAGWQQGNGAVESIKKENVKTDFIKHKHRH